MYSGAENASTVSLVVLTNVFSYRANPDLSRDPSCIHLLSDVINNVFFLAVCAMFFTKEKQGKLLSDWSVGNFLSACAFFAQCKQDGCRRGKNMQSIFLSRKESISRSCLSSFMYSIFSLVAVFVMAGNNRRHPENFSAIYEGLKSARSLCGSLRMLEKSYKAKRGQCVGTSSSDVKLAV